MITAVLCVMVMTGVELNFGYHSSILLYLYFNAFQSWIQHTNVVSVTYLSDTLSEKSTMPVP